MSGRDEREQAEVEEVDRRSLLRRVGVAAAAAAGVAAVGASEASANSGDPVILGRPNSSDSDYTMMGASGTVLLVNSSATRPGPALNVLGNGNDAIEAKAFTAGRSAIFAHNDGESAGGQVAYGVFGGAANGEGVHGQGRRGVVGVSQSSGGIGVRAEAGAEGSTALQVIGKTSFTRSGVASVLAATNSVAVKPNGGVGTASFVVATVQGTTTDVWVTASPRRPAARRSPSF